MQQILSAFSMIGWYSSMKCNRLGHEKTSDMAKIKTFEDAKRYGPHG